jgi:hypothetical protein
VLSLRFFKISLAVVTLGIGLGLTTVTPVKASTYHSGTPKALRGTWYLVTDSPKQYITYWQNHTGMNTLVYSNNLQAYYKNDPYGLTYVKYKSLGNDAYRIAGWTYSTNQDYRGIASNSEHYTYNVKKISKNYIYLYDRNTVYRKKPNFRLVTINY